MWYYIIGLASFFIGLMLPSFTKEYKRCVKEYEEFKYTINGTKLEDFLNKLLSECPLYFSSYSHELKQIILKNVISLSGVNLYRFNSDDLCRIIHRILIRNYNSDIVCSKITNENEQYHFKLCCQKFKKMECSYSTIETALDWDSIIREYNRNPNKDFSTDARILKMWIAAFGSDDLLRYGRKKDCEE